MANWLLMNWSFDTLIFGQLALGENQCSAWGLLPGAGMRPMGAPGRLNARPKI